MTPSMTRYEMIGVTSFGSNCGVVGQPGKQTKRFPVASVQLGSRILVYHHYKVRCDHMYLICYVEGGYVRVSYIIQWLFQKMQEAEDDKVFVCNGIFGKWFHG